MENAGSLRENSGSKAMRHIDMDAILAQRNGASSHVPKLGVVYPWQSPFFYTRCAESLLHLQRPAGYDVDFFRGSGWSPAVRHISGCEQAYAWGADYIVIVGSDQLYEPDILCRLIARMHEGYEAVACMIPTRGYLAWNQGMKPFGKVAWRFKPSIDGLQTVARQYRGQFFDGDMLELIDPADGAMQQCHFVGSGVLMFRREHLDALKKPWFFESIDPNSQQRFASMDTRFAWRLQWEAWATLWVDTTINVRHLHIFAVDDTFPDRFADWGTQHPCMDDDPMRYAPTAFPHSTTDAESTPEPAMHPKVLPARFFDEYRARYDLMTFADHQRAYSLVESIYPEQQCFDEGRASRFFEALIAHQITPSVIELGGWKGELAQCMLSRYRDITIWHNVEICREAVGKTVCRDSRYTTNTLDGFFWDMKPRFIGMCNTMVLSHVVEHMRLQNFSDTIAHCANEHIEHVYLDVPHLTDHSCKTWHGWTSMHVFEAGWADIERIMATHGYQSFIMNGQVRCYTSTHDIAHVSLSQEQPVYASI